MKKYLALKMSIRENVLKNSIKNVHYSDKFYNFLVIELKNTNNTIQRHFIQLKSILKWSNERGARIIIIDDVFKIKGFEVEIIALENYELEMIINTNLDLNSKLEKTRDLFLFQTYTGQRFLDVQHLIFSDIIDDIWILRAEKTNTLLHIPLSQKALNILAKYKMIGHLPKISNQKMNQNLKELCKISGINSIYTTTSYSGGQKIEMKTEKYNLISSHTARKTFVTIAMEKGIPSEMIMKFTGHRDHRVFERYYQLTDKSKQKAIQKIWD